MFASFIKELHLCMEEGKKELQNMKPWYLLSLSKDNLKSAGRLGLLTHLVAHQSNYRQSNQKSVSANPHPRSAKGCALKACLLCLFFLNIGHMFCPEGS